MSVRATFGVNDQIYATLTSHNELRVFDVLSGKCELIHQDDNEKFTCIAVSAVDQPSQSNSKRKSAGLANEPLLLVGCQSGNVQIISLSSLSVLSVAKASGSAITSIAVNQGRRSMYVASSGSMHITEISLKDGKEELSSIITSKTAPVSLLSVSSDSQLMITCNDSKIRMWNIKGQSACANLVGCMQAPKQVISNGKLCVGVDGSETVYVWDVSNPAAVAKLLQADGPVNRVCFGSDSRVIALLASGAVSEFSFTLEAPLAVTATRSEVSLARKFGSVLCVSETLTAACGQLPGALKFKPLFVPESSAVSAETATTADVAAVTAVTVLSQALKAPEVDESTQMQIESQASLSAEAIAAEGKARVSLAPVIRQGLAGKDKKMLETVINCTLSSTMAVSARELSCTDVAGFLDVLVDRFENHPGSILAVTNWVSHLIKSHAAFIMSQQRLRTRLEPLHAGISARVKSYGDLQKLQGRLSAVMACASRVTPQVALPLEPLVRWRDT